MSGLIYRDLEGAKIDTVKLRELGFQYRGVFNPKEFANSPLPINNPELRKDIITRYFHHATIGSIVTPLARFMLGNLGYKPEDVIEFRNDILIEEMNSDFPRNNSYDIEESNIPDLKRQKPEENERLTINDELKHLRERIGK